MTRQVDLNAPIVPGRSAGGFSLGENLANIEADLPNITDWLPEEWSLAEAVTGTEQWLRSRIYSARGEFQGTILTFGRGALELHFAAHGPLCQIFLFAGYQGTVLGNVAVGDRLEAVLAHCSLTYDDGDEMYYPDEHAELAGLGFYAAPPNQDEVDRKILGISAHDWKLQRGR